MDFQKHLQILSLGAQFPVTPRLCLPVAEDRISFPGDKPIACILSSFSTSSHFHSLLRSLEYPLFKDFRLALKGLDLMLRELQRLNNFFSLLGAGKVLIKNEANFCFLYVFFISLWI